MKAKKVKRPSSKNKKTVTAVNNWKKQLIDVWLFLRPTVKNNLGHAFRFLSLIFIGGLYLGLGSLFFPLFDAAASIGTNSLSINAPFDQFRPTVDLKFGEPDWSTNNPHVASKIASKITLPETPIWNEGGCFHGLFYFVILEKSAYTEPLRYGRGSYPEKTLSPKLCFVVDGTTTYITSRPNASGEDSYTLVSGRPPYYYPFDWAELKVEIRLEGDENIGSKKESRFIPVNITGVVDAKNWDTKVDITDEFDFSTNRPYALVVVHYDRPLLYRVIPVAVLATIFFVIFYMPRIKDKSSFLEVMIGLIFGIWGIKQVIVPTFVTWTTILDPIILGLYMCLCISVLIKFVVMPLQTQIDKIAETKDE